MVKNSKKLLACPTCKKETEKQDNKYFPFCSERCKLIDLGSWLDGKYILPENESPSRDEEN
jgi:endogenous inhibitor of DNA gyrase (YacG/DUF329 family)